MRRTSLAPKGLVATGQALVLFAALLGCDTPRVARSRPPEPARPPSTDFISAWKNWEGPEVIRSFAELRYRTSLAALAPAQEHPAPPQTSAPVEVYRVSPDHDL